MMVMRMAGQFHSHGALTGESPLQAQGEIVCVIQTHHSRWPDSCKVLTLAPDSDKDLCTVDLRSPLSTNSSVTFFFFFCESHVATTCLFLHSVQRIQCKPTQEGSVASVSESEFWSQNDW